MQKSADAFRTISEVADDLSLPQHVLRFWETRFPQIRPLKRAGGRRYYRPADVTLLKAIRQLLYDDGYTIKGVQRLLKEQGAKGLSAGAPPPELDWTEPEEPEVPAPLPDIDAAADLSEDSHRPDPATPNSQGSRNAVEDALETIAECQRILHAALRPTR